MNIESIRIAIHQGQFDTNLSDLMNDLHSRQKALLDKAARENARALSPGDTATLSGLRPKRINGATVTITKINRTRADVTFNDPRFESEYPAGVKVPLSSLTPTGEKNTTPAPAAGVENPNGRFRMGAPVSPPEGLSMDEQLKWFDDYTKGKDVIRFQVADGYATYEVRGNSLHHIQSFDTYAAHPALLRGLTRGEVNDMLESERRMDALYAKK